jgi:hypothetical protein
MNTSSLHLSSLGQTAVAYATKYGWEVFPIGERAKDHPKIAWGEGATSDPATLAGFWHQWPHANIALATGIRSGIAAVDIDPRHGGDEVWESLLTDHGRCDTLEVVTGSGGRHVYFKAPDVALRSVNGGLGQGIDIKATGGYVVAPPSVHPNGNTYFWDNAGTAPAPLPEWLLDLWPLATPDLAEPSIGRAVAVTKTMPLGRRALFFVAHGAPPGEQRSQAVAAARNYLSAGYSTEDTADALWKGFQSSVQDWQTPWRHEDARTIAEDLARRPAPTPTSAARHGGAQHKNVRRPAVEVRG